MAGEGSIVSGLAGRYATALFELAVEAKKVDAVASDLAKFQALVAQSEDLKRLVESPVFGAEEQEKAVAAVLAKAGIAGLAANFIKTAAANRRLFAVKGMIAAYSALVSAHKGEVVAEVTAAESLSAKNQKDLADSLKASLGKEPKIEVIIDPAILGGLIVKVGSRMVDSSLRTKLNSLKSAMKEVG